MVLPPGPAGLKFWQPRVESTEADWFTLYALTPLSSEAAGWTGFTIRQVVPVAGYDGSVPATGTKLRVTIQGGASAGVDWTKCYIGHAATSGDAYDFDGTQVQVLFSGNAGGSVPAGRVSLASDPVTYAFDKTKPLVISLYVGGPADSLGERFPVTGFAASYKSGDDAATTNASAYTAYTAVQAFSKVEVYFPAVADSGPITLPADSGSYTLTGTDVGLGLGYWITGFDAAFTTATAGGTTLAAAAGSYTLTGVAAALNLGAAAGSSSYALTGAAATLNLGHVAGSGSYSLTGSAAALALRHTAGAGSYSLTGAAAAYRITLTASAGSYVLTGSPAGFVAPFNLPAAGGAYTLTGFDAGLTVISGIVLFCGSGSYTLTGSDAALPPLVTQPVPPTDNYTGGGVRRIRKFGPRKRKRDELEELLDAIAVTPPEIPALPPIPEAPPAPGLMADVPMPSRTVLRSLPDEDEDEIALLLELIS